VVSKLSLDNIKQTLEKSLNIEFRNKFNKLVKSNVLIVSIIFKQLESYGPKYEAKFKFLLIAKNRVNNKTRLTQNGGRVCQTLQILKC